MLNDDINDIGKKFSPEEKEKILANAKKTYGEIKKSLETEGGNIAEEVRELVTRQLLKLSKAIQNEKTDPNTLTVISNQVQDSYTNQDTDKAKKLLSKMKAANKKKKEDDSFGTMSSVSSNSDSQEDTTTTAAATEKPSKATLKNIPAGNKETQEKYASSMDKTKPLDAWVLALRCVYETGTMPTQEKGMDFNRGMFKKLESSESSNERYMKKVAKELYEEKFDEGDGEIQKKLSDQMDELLNYVKNEAGETLERKLNTKMGKMKDVIVKRKYLTDNGGMIPYLRQQIAEKHPYVSYAGTKQSAAAAGVERKDYIMACIYYRLYYIYIMYRFATAIGEIRILADPQTAVKLAKIKKLDNSKLGNASSEQSTFGTEKNVANIFVQAIKQAEQIQLADITTMESFLGAIDGANRFLGEAPETSESEAEETQVTKLPKVLTDFITIMKMVQARKAFTSEKFNDLIKSNELNKVDLMQGWLNKNEKISQGNDYLATALKFMVYSKMYGTGGDVGWAKTFAKRNPKTIAALKAPAAALKVGKKALGIAKKLI
jgi:hypothetical protein